MVGSSRISPTVRYLRIYQPVGLALVPHAILPLRHIFLNLISLDMSIRLRQTRGNVVAADDANIAGLNQVWPRQFHLPR